jgi:phytoene desaturase
MQQKSATIIGAGFSGLSIASFLAKAGYKVTVVEKHAIPGGRARKLEADGFTFDMGPSWYWMPDVFERYFAQFNKKVSDYYALERLDPSYRVYWNDEPMDIPANYQQLQQLFNSIEAGSAKKLDLFLEEAAYKYQVGINKLVFKPGQSLTEFIDADLLKGIFRLDVFNSIKSHVSKLFKNKKLQQLLEFPVLFLGALPEKTPALYSLMNYADIKGGTWYPKGGMYKIVEGMYQLALELGVTFTFNCPVQKIIVQNNKAVGVELLHHNVIEEIYSDVVVGSADYNHIETTMLAAEHRSYTDAYWDSRVMAPSCLLYYVGLNKKLIGIPHHSLFFDTDFGVHGTEIYSTKQWPTNPLFYASITSVTDDTVAPNGCENLFLLIPVATGLQGDTEALREKYFDMIVERMEHQTKQSIKQNVIYKKSFALTDFENEYGAFKGNAYGLANTILQTAILKPACKSKKVKNLYYTGQLTVPGPGVPPSLISGEVVAKEIIKNNK